MEKFKNADLKMNAARIKIHEREYVVMLKNPNFGIGPPCNDLEMEDLYLALVEALETLRALQVAGHRLAQCRQGTPAGRAAHARAEFFKIAQQMLSDCQLMEV